MLTDFGLLSMVGGLLIVTASDTDRTLTLVRSPAVPTIEAVLVYPAGAVRPGKPRPKPVLTAAKLGAPLTLPGNGPYDVYVRPKGGIEVRVAGKLAFKPGQAREVKLGDVLGVVEVFQGDMPPVGRLVLTDPLDPGPDEKGHVPLQSAADYRTEMAVPEGFYAVWLVPANGARARRIEDRIRVLPGRHVRIGN